MNSILRFAIFTVLLLGVPAWAQDGPAKDEPAGEKPAQTEPAVEKQPPAKPAPAPPPRRGRQVLDEVVARVNNKIITRSDLTDADEALRREISDRHKGDELLSQFDEQSKDTLRGLIDVQLLVQYGTDRGYSVESEVLQRLDLIRQDMGLDSMEALERAMLAEGVGIEDFKERLRDQFMYDMVIQRDVARSVFLDDESIEQYFEEHKEEFSLPEAVRLIEILVSTRTRTVEEAADRARQVLARIRSGADFADLAREFSDSSTAERGGELGTFAPEDLSPEVRELVSKLLEDGVADPQLTPEGYVILKLAERSAEGIPPLERVRGEIMNRMYQEKMRPAFREFLNQMRADNYVYVKVGYTDSGAIPVEPKPILRGKRRRKARSTH